VKRTVSDSTNFLVGEEYVFVVVSISVGLLDESGRKAECVGLVVRQLRVHEVIDLHDI
jgi:tRNA(Phe) wybutosine-synthesizing methylase Tyw3